MINTNELDVTRQKKKKRKKKISSLTGGSETHRKFWELVSGGSAGRPEIDDTAVICRGRLQIFREFYDYLSMGFITFKLTSQYIPRDAR